MMNSFVKLTLNGKECKAVSNALLPRLYRFHFGRDFIVDMKKLNDDYKRDGVDGVDTQIFESITWLMLKQGGSDVGESVDDWLATINIFELYSTMEKVLGLLNVSQKTTSKPKKK